MAETSSRRLRRVYLLPNLFTAFNLALGLMGIFNVLGGNINKACWYIVWAAILDGLDGAVARLTHTESEFGLQFDSLSDLVSFGVAPAVVTFSLARQVAGVNERLVLGVAILYAVCGALRLARYNVQAKGSERKGFLGLPIPGGAMCVLLPVMTLIEHDLADSAVLVGLVPFLLAGIAMLMVSEVPYPSVIKRLRVERRMSFDSMISLFLIIILVLSVHSDMRVTVFCALSYAYVGYGLANWGLARRRSPQRRRAA